MKKLLRPHKTYFFELPKWHRARRFKVLLFVIGLVLFNNLNAQVLLEANGPGNTYELINSVLAPVGGDVVESAECVHPEFGRHIAEVWDADLNQYVFEFYIHVTPDNDRCINFDRQRVEIKTYEDSPDYLKGVSGETVIYKWRFKVPTGFKPSSSFTHIHQVKAVGGDAADPIFVLTARKGTPNKLELNYYSDSNLSSQKLIQVNLSLFENTWVEATERIKIDNVNGTYSLIIKKVSDGATVLSYSNSKLLTFRSDNLFIRPKWGIYRSLNSPSDLRDDSLRFNSFSIEEVGLTSLKSVSTSEISCFKVLPNLISSIAKIQYDLKKETKLKLDILGLNGQVLKNVFENKNQQQGQFLEYIDLCGMPSGVYFAKLTTSESVNVAKFIVLRN